MTSMTASMPAAPATIWRMNFSCPGTSTMLTVFPDGSVKGAKPSSIVMPRFFSSDRRSQSTPVRRLTSVVLPWSMWPAVPITNGYSEKAILYFPFGRGRQYVRERLKYPFFVAGAHGAHVEEHSVVARAGYDGMRAEAQPPPRAWPALPISGSRSATAQPRSTDCGKEPPPTVSSTGTGSIYTRLYSGVFEEGFAACARIAAQRRGVRLRV